MKLVLDLTAEQEQAVLLAARRLGVSLEALASAAVADLLARPAEDFDRAARLVLEKNRELYERLRR